MAVKICIGQPSWARIALTKLVSNCYKYSKLFSKPLLTGGRWPCFVVSRDRDVDRLLIVHDTFKILRILLLLDLGLLQLGQQFLLTMFQTRDLVLHLDSTLLMVLDLLLITLFGLALHLLLPLFLLQLDELGDVLDAIDLVHLLSKFLVVLLFVLLLEFLGSNRLLPSCFL